MLETHQLIAAANDAIGAKRVASALSISLQHAYKLAADPLVVDAPVRNDFDRINALMEALAARPDARPTLIQFELHFREMFDRLVRRETAKPMSPSDVILKAQELCAEVGDVLRECKPGYCPEKIAKEASELIAVLERLVAMAEAADDVPDIKPRLRPA